MDNYDSNLMLKAFLTNKISTVPNAQECRKII